VIGADILLQGLRASIYVVALEKVPDKMRVVVLHTKHVVLLGNFCHFMLTIAQLGNFWDICGGERAALRTFRSLSDAAIPRAAFALAQTVTEQP